jgi:protein-arginine deiminase
VDEVLADPDIMADSASAALLIEAQLAVLRSETGLTDAEVVRVPFLHHPIDGVSTAYQPGTVNGLLIDPHTWAAPDPHGPIVDGKDLFKVQLEQTLGAVGLAVRWVENWNLYHRDAGEVHCGTNVSRELANAAWWEVVP